MSKTISYLRSLKNYVSSLPFENFDSLVVVARDYSELPSIYADYANSGGFAKSSTKAFPLFSRVYVFDKLDTPIFHDDDSVTFYEPIFRCEGLENAICAIPEGIYELDFSFSPKFHYSCPIVLDVPKRSGIRIHIGNHAKDSIGCILVGEKRSGLSIEHSTNAFRKLVEKLDFSEFRPTRVCLCVCDLNKFINP